MILINHLAEVTDIWLVSLHLEDVNLFAVSGMVADRLVACTELHISALTLPVIVENASFPPIFVTKWFTGLAREEKDHCVLCGCADTASLLSPELLVQLPPLVESTNLELVAQMDKLYGI